MPSPKRDELFCFTSYETDEKGQMVEPFYDPIYVQYMVYGWELCPTTNKQHLQGFVAMMMPCSFTEVRKHLKHSLKKLFSCKGTASENVKYCKEDGKWKEFGKCPEDKVKEKRQKDKDLEIINEVKVKIAKGEMTARDAYFEYPQVCQYSKTIQAAEEIFRMKRKERDTMCEIHWIVGDTGSGKSYYCRKIVKPTPYNKLHDEQGVKWWDGYDGEESIVLDDFRGLIPYNQLLIWADEYAAHGNIKNKSPVKLLFTRIYIPCIKYPHEVYTGQMRSNNEPLSQLLRRMKIFEMKDRVPVDITEAYKKRIKDI